MRRNDKILLKIVFNNINLDFIEYWIVHMD